MRSLWRDLAVQWLGGEGSAALDDESALLDRFAIMAQTTAPAFRTSRIDGVSHQALLRAAPPPLPLLAE
jgi:hypothetical protein